MLIDDLKQQLGAAAPDVLIIKNYWSNAGTQKEFDELSAQINNEHFWQNKNQAQISKRFEHVKELKSRYEHVVGAYTELGELLDLFAQEEHELVRLAGEIKQFLRTLRKFKIELLLNDIEDQSNCFLSINAGAGGTEAQDWAEMVLRMYVRFCEDNKLNASVMDYQSGEGAGIKSATLYIKGPYAYGLLKTEHGIHRLVRISPFDANKRRHTSFCSVSIIPEYEEAEEIVIDPKDLRVDTYRSGGAGGQHVNKTESAIRITHLPTNIVVQCQNERSQIQNRETAMKMLKAKLVQKQKEERAAQEGKIEKKTIEWGSQIRSYVLHPYKMVKDHRTDYTSQQPDLVLDGDLMDFIEHTLVANAK